MTVIRSIPAGIFIAFLFTGMLHAEQILPDLIPEFINNYCANCHDDMEKKADLDLWSLSEDPVTMENLETWVKAYDRATAGEMPPAGRDRPDPDDLAGFGEALAATIIRTEKTHLERTGRTTKRRLNRYEYENALRDLLGLPYLEIRNTLPEDTTAHGYNKVGEALDVSHVQIARYLKAAEYSLREAIAAQPDLPEKIHKRYYTWKQAGFNKPVGPDLRKSWPIVGLELQPELYAVRKAALNWEKPDWAEASVPGREEQEAVVMLMSTYEPAEIKFNNFRAPVTGPYRLKFAGYSVWMAPDYSKVTRGRRSEPITIYSETPPRQLRRLGAVDFHPDSTVSEMVVWLKKGESIQPDAARLVRSRPQDFKNPLLEEDGMPGAAFQWMEVEGPLFKEWPLPGHKLLFGDLAPGSEPDDKEEVSRYLLSRFMNAAYRRPVSNDELQRFQDLILYAMDAGHSFVDSMLAGYTAVLSSPAFLYLDPKPGRLDAYALADRLSFFLTNGPPDKQLRKLAESGEILHPDVLDNEVERLLDHPSSRRFVDAFLDYWLDLRFMAASGPDAELYPEYQLDDQLTESLPIETQLYFKELIDNDLGVDHIVDSDFIMINERLGTLYDMPEIRGAHFRRVELPAQSVRGGIMTQGSVLKVTANGTSSSPVLRGVWIMERILGYHSPPPPPTVTPIESDIRGAKTIREQLELHRSEPSCNSCHVKIDPAGFALENFDVMGAYRDRYRTSNDGEGEPVSGAGHDGLRIRYKIGLPVDASGELPDGRTFNDIRELKALLLEDPELLTKNLVSHLSIYATGTPVHFSDRAEIDQIVMNSRDAGYGIRSIIRELVKSELFLSK